MMNLKALIESRKNGVKKVNAAAAAEKSEPEAKVKAVDTEETPKEVKKPSAREALLARIRAKNQAAEAAPASETKTEEPSAKVKTEAKEETKAKEEPKPEAKKKIIVAKRPKIKKESVKTEEPAAEPIQETKADAKAEEIVVPEMVVAKKDEPKVEKEEVPAEKPVETEVPKMENAPEIPEVDEAAIEAEAEAILNEINGEKAEEPVKAVRSTSKKASTKTKKASKAEESKLSNDGDIAIVGNLKMDYDEAMALIHSEYESDDWLELKKSVMDALDDIQLKSDMPVGSLKYAMVQADRVYAMICTLMAEMSATLEMLTAEKDGLATAYRYVGSTGSNEETRKANGIRTLTEIEFKGKKVNLIALIAATRLRHKFLQNVLWRLKFLQDTGRILLGNAKIEQEFVRMAG